MLADFSSHVLPLIFFAMHEEITDENRDTVELWKELWLEVSPGDAGIRLNLDAIIPTLEQSLNDPSWLIKAQAANSINTLATRLRTQLLPADRERLIAGLLDGVAGRTFHGKERLLQALASLSRDLDKQAATSSHQAIIDAVMKECRKEEPLYRTHALRAIGTILEQLNEDRFEEVYNMIWYLMDKKDLAAVTGEDDDNTLSADDRNKRAMVVIQLKEVVCETLGKAWPANSAETQQKYQLQFVERCVQCLQTNTRPVQLSLLVALGKFLDRLQILEVLDADATGNLEKKAKVEADVQLDKICKDVLSAVVFVAGDFFCVLVFIMLFFYNIFNTFSSGIPHTGVKKEALSIMLTLAKKLSDKKYVNELEQVRRTFDTILQMLQKDSAPEIKCRIRDIEDQLKSV